MFFSNNSCRHSNTHRQYFHIMRSSCLFREVFSPFACCMLAIPIWYPLRKMKSNLLNNSIGNPCYQMCVFFFCFSFYFPFMQINFWNGHGIVVMLQVENNKQRMGLMVVCFFSGYTFQHSSSQRASFSHVSQLLQSDYWQNSLIK